MMEKMHFRLVFSQKHYKKCKLYLIIIPTSTKICNFASQIKISSHEDYFSYSICGTFLLFHTR